jgi:cell division protein FtsB
MTSSGEVSVTHAQTGSAVRGARRRKPRWRIRHVVLLLFVAWGAWQYYAVTRPLLEHNAAQRALVAREMAATIAQQKAYEAQLRELHSYSYIAQIAAQKYNLVMPGEILFTGSDASS